MVHVWGANQTQLTRKAPAKVSLHYEPGYCVYILCIKLCLSGIQTILCENKFAQWINLLKFLQMTLHDQVKYTDNAQYVREHPA